MPAAMIQGSLREEREAGGGVLGLNTVGGVASRFPLADSRGGGVITVAPLAAGMGLIGTLRRARLGVCFRAIDMS